MTLRKTLLGGEHTVSAFGTSANVVEVHDTPPRVNVDSIIYGTDYHFSLPRTRSAGACADWQSGLIWLHMSSI